MNIESKWQNKWRKAGIFQANPSNDKKLFLTVAYPYPSGAMHIGHGRTYTVPDVYARFKRMQGYNVLFPMAWHVTGAPVIGIARRIERKDPWTMKIYKEVHKVPPVELKKFSDPKYIVEYFSKEYRHLMEAMGYSIDWRREFKTTDPHYQRFIEWQIKKLKEKGLIRKGKHPVKYCPECENPVGDHDLLEGEGVGINELTLLEFELDGSYLPAATFRPETIFGVTNLWLNPNEKYVKVKVDDKTWIISEKSYENLSQQKRGMKVLGEVDPERLIGLNVKNPMTGDEHPILPAYFVDPEYGTGVVFSVPAHAPADYIALIDLKNNTKLQREYNIGAIVEKIEPINVITIEGYGDYPAHEIVEKFKVKNQNDPKLDDATNELYKIEHAKGVISPHIPDYAGEPVSEARERIAKHLKEEGKAEEMFDFSDHPVICRCGSRCVVKIMENQWFIKYSDPEWKDLTLECLKSMKIVPEEVRANFEYYIEWFNDWACARRIGLGTPLPWDPDWIIEPLSDSTIYMSYYTIAHHLKNLPIKEVDDEFFDKIFLKKPDTNGDIKRISSEFNYWYPLDWRLSAKDLIGNHLTFHLFHHSAIFPPSKWPRGIVVFGMGLLEGKKMSSSKGNIVLLRDAIEAHGADVVRLFLMSSAEPWQDFDWREKEVMGIKRRLEWFIEFGDEIKEIIGSKRLSDIRPPDPSSPINKWMTAKLNLHIKNATKALENFQTRKAIQESFFLLKKDVDHYMRRVRGKLDDREVKEVLRYLLSVWIRLMAPFIPHTAEEMWEKYNSKGFVSEAPWPEFKEELIDLKVQKAEEIVQVTVKDILEIKKILNINPEKVHIYIAPEWKWRIFEIAKEMGKPKIGDIMQRAIAEGVHEDKREIAEFSKKIVKEMIREEYPGRLDEHKILSDAREYIEGEIGAKVIIYKDAEYDPEGKAKNAIPYKPAIYVE